MPEPFGFLFTLPALPIINAKELFVSLGFEPAWASIDGFSGRLAGETRGVDTSSRAQVAVPSGLT